MSSTLILALSSTLSGKSYVRLSLDQCSQLISLAMSLTTFLLLFMFIITYIYLQMYFFNNYLFIKLQVSLRWNSMSILLTITVPVSVWVHAYSKLGIQYKQTDGTIKAKIWLMSSQHCPFQNTSFISSVTRYVRPKRDMDTVFIDENYVPQNQLKLSK